MVGWRWPPGSLSLIYTHFPTLPDTDCVICYEKVDQVLEGSGHYRFDIVPDLEGCLRDCTSCLEDETKEEWGNLVESLFRVVVDKIQELMDMVKLAWVEMGMEERLHKPSLERCAWRREAVSVR